MQFDPVENSRRQGSVRFCLSDTLMLALAMFQFKSSLLLQFDKRVRYQEDDTLAGNVQRSYWLSSVPGSAQMRTILDEVLPATLRRAFREGHSAVQRGRMLEDYKVRGDKLVVSVDGKGLFSSTRISCQHGGVKKRSSGTDEYYHQRLAEVTGSPHQATVLPIDVEPITRSDEEAKDCSARNAARRLIPSIAQQYAKRKSIIVEFALACNGPHVKLLYQHRMDFVIVCRSKSSVALFCRTSRSRIGQHSEI